MLRSYSISAVGAPVPLRDATEPVGLVVDGFQGLWILDVDGERLFCYVEDWKASRDAFRAQPMTAGSKGQPVLSPLAAHMKDLEASISALEAALGIGPMNKQKLGLVFGEAHKSIEEVRAHYRKERE